MATLTLYFIDGLKEKSLIAEQSAAQARVHEEKAKQSFQELHELTGLSASVFSKEALKHFQSGNFAAAERLQQQALRFWVWWLSDLL